MKLIVQAIFVFLLLPVGIFAQGNCNNPIQLDNIFITPSCGGDNGAIYFSLPSGNYAWTGCLPFPTVNKRLDWPLEIILFTYNVLMSPIVRWIP